MSIGISVTDVSIPVTRVTFCADAKKVQGVDYRRLEDKEACVVNVWEREVSSDGNVQPIRVTGTYIVPTMYTESNSNWVLDICQYPNTFTATSVHTVYPA